MLDLNVLVGNRDFRLSLKVIMRVETIFVCEYLNKKNARKFIRAKINFIRIHMTVHRRIFRKLRT